MKEILKKILSAGKRILARQNIIQGQLALGINSTISGSEVDGKLTSLENCVINKVNINGRVTMGKFTSLWGPNINLHGEIEIGSFCSIASNVTMIGYNHKSNTITSYYIFKNFFKEPIIEVEATEKITIGSDVWIGNGATILAGVKIGHGSIIAASATVVEDVAPYSIVAGVPAKHIRYRFSQEIIDRLLALSWWNWDESKIRRNKKLFEKPLILELLNDIKE